MPFQDMISEIHGSVPSLPWDYAATLVNRAWQDVRRQCLWSFLLVEGNWTTPSPITVGTATVTQGSTQVTFDAVASAAILAVAMGPPSVIIQRQFRIGVGTVYNIWGVTTASGTLTWNTATGTWDTTLGTWDSNSATTLILTLDRPYQEASGTGVTYSIYQCYYPAPVQDWWAWLSIRDMVNAVDLMTTKPRHWVDERDPQRQIYWLPTYVVPYQTDLNPASPTYGWMLFELWGTPYQVLTYQLYGVRKGLPLANPTDTLPMQVGEDCVVALAKKHAYAWAEANKGDQPRAVGSDYRFLMGDAETEYKRLFREYRKQDMELVNNYKLKMRRSLGWLGNYYNSITQTASPGGSPYLG